MFQYYDTIVEGDIIPVQHKGDLLYYAYLSCSDPGGVVVDWDGGDMTHVEWYIGARLIDRYPLKFPHVAKTYSELTETRLFQPLRFSYPIPMVCLQYEKMYLKVIGAPKASLRYTCHMVYMNLTPEERMKIATEPYSMHIEQHHEVNPDQLYIHAPIKYFITSEFQYTNKDSIELYVNGQRTSGPILSEYFSPYSTPAEPKSILYPTRDTIITASSESREQVEPPSKLWISKYNKLTPYNIVTSASSNSTFAYAATGPLGWISDSTEFGQETVYTVTASPNDEGTAYKSTTSDGWTSTQQFGNTASLSAITIVGSNVSSKGNLLSATSYWLADTEYTADAVGRYNVYTSTGTLSAANQWTSSNTFGTSIPVGEYSIEPSSAWPVLDENATTSWSNIEFGQTLYTQSITGNNASSNLNLNVLPAKLFDADSQSGWVSNSAANIYGHGSNAGVYAVTPSASWRAFDGTDTTSWTGGSEFQAQIGTIPNARMNAFSNVGNAWLASDYNDATAWISNTLVYGQTLPTPFLDPISPDTSNLYGRTANIVIVNAATSNIGNVANALAWTNTVSWTSNLSFGQVTVPQGTYTYTPAPTTSYSNETVAAVTSLSAGYTGFSAYTNSSVHFVTNPIPGRYETNVSGAYNTTRISEATIATLLPAGEATKSRSNITGSLLPYNSGTVTTSTSNIFNKFPSGTFAELTRTLLSGNTYTWTGVLNASDGRPVGTPALTIQGPTGTGNVAYTLSEPTGLTGTWERLSDFASNVFRLTSTSATQRVYDTSSPITVTVDKMSISSTRQRTLLGTLEFPVGMVDGTTITSDFGTGAGASVNVVTTRTLNSPGFTPTGISLSGQRDGVFVIPFVTLSGTTISYRADFTLQKTDVSIYNKMGQFTNRISFFTASTAYMYYPAFAYNGETFPNPILIHGYVVGLYSTGSGSTPGIPGYTNSPSDKLFHTSAMIGCLYPRVLNTEYQILITLYTAEQVGIDVSVLFLRTSSGVDIQLQTGLSLPSNHSLRCYKTVRNRSGGIVSQNDSVTLSSTSTPIMNTTTGDMYTKLTFVYIGNYESFNMIDVHIIALDSSSVAYVYTDEMYTSPGFIPYSFTKDDAYSLVSVIRDRSMANLYAEKTTISSVRLIRGGTVVPLTFGSGTSYNVRWHQFTNNDDNTATKSESGYNSVDTQVEIQSHPTHLIVSLKRFQSELYTDTAFVTIGGLQLFVQATNPRRYVTWADIWALSESDLNLYRNYLIQFKTLFIEIVSPSRFRISMKIDTGDIYPYSGWRPSTYDEYYEGVSYINYTHLYIALKNRTLVSPLIQLDYFPLTDEDGYTYAYGNFINPVDGTLLELTSDIWSDRSISFADVEYIIFVDYSPPSPLSLRVNYTAIKSTQISTSTRRRIHFGYVEPVPGNPRFITVPSGFRTGEFTTGVCITQGKGNDEPYLGYRERYWHALYRFNTAVVYPPVQTEYIRLVRGWNDYNLTDAVYYHMYDISRIYDISRVRLSITNAGTYDSTSRTLPVTTFGSGISNTLTISLTSAARHIKSIRFMNSVVNVTPPSYNEVYLGRTRITDGSVTTRAPNTGQRIFDHVSYFTQNEFAFEYKAGIDADIDFTLSKIDLLDTHNNVIGSLTPTALSTTISSGFITSISNVSVTASLNTSAVTDQYRIQFDGLGNPINVINTSRSNRQESLQLNGRFANMNAVYTIFSNVAVSTVSPGTFVSQSHTEPLNSFRTVCSLSTVGWVPSGQLACSYTVAPYQDTTISLTFPRAVTVGRVDINSSYGPKFQIFNGTTAVTPTTQIGNVYTFGSQTISALHIRPSLAALTSITPLTLSNIIVYDDIGCRISPSISGTTLTMYSGGVRLATTDGNVYTGYSFDSSETTRPLTNFIGKEVTFTANVHQNALGVGATISTIPITNLGTGASVTTLSVIPSSGTGSSATVAALGAVKEYTLSFTVRNWGGLAPRIGSNVLVANVFEGGRNQANAFITLGSQQVYGGVMSSNLGSLYTVSARNTDTAAWAPAVIGTSYSQYSYTLTQSNVYQPSVYFKLIRPSGVELHKDSGDSSTTVGLAPVGEYRLTAGVPPGLFTKEGLATPLNTPVTLTFPRQVTVTRILVSGTSVTFDNTSYRAGETLLQTPVTSHTFTFSLTDVTRILLFNTRGLITPRLVGTTPTGNYWVSNTLSSNVLVTPPVFGWSFPLANVTGYTITSSQGFLPYKLNVSSGTTVLDRWRNVDARSYTAIFPAPRQLTSLGCNVLELVDTSNITDFSLQLIVYSRTFTPLSTPTTSVTISSNIYGPPVFCAISGPSVPTGSRTVISNLQSGTDTTTFDFGSNVVNITNITYSTLTTLTTTPGLLRLLGSNVSVVGQFDTTATGAAYRGRMYHPDVGTGTWNDIRWDTDFTITPNPSSSLTLGSADQSDLYPFSTVGIQLGGTLQYSVISSLTYRAGGHLYAYKLSDVSVQAILNGVPGASQGGTSGTYRRIDIRFPDTISQIQVYGITVTTETSKTDWSIWCRAAQLGQSFGIVTTEGSAQPTLSSSVTDVSLPTQPPFSNIFGVRMIRSGDPCHFSNITLYNDIGAVVNTDDVRGRGFESFSFTPQSSVQFKSYSFVSDPPITSWTLKNDSVIIDSVLVNSNVNVYRELSGVVPPSGTITLEISNAVGRAHISDFKLYSEAYQMVTSNATASVMYGSALAGRYAIYTSYSPTYASTLMPFNSGFYTRASPTELVEGPWIQIEMPIPIVVSKCFFYGNHRLYTLFQSSDRGASWTTVCTGDADVYREINPVGPPAQFFRFVCQSVYGASWNVDIALCNSLGERLNPRRASEYIRYPNYFGGRSRTSPPQTISYTVPSALSNIYMRNTNVSNVIIGGQRTTMTIVSDGFRQFTPGTPIPSGPTNIVIDGIDDGVTATWTDIELLDATHRPMIYRGNVMVSTVPQGYYEFSGNRITFPISVTPSYSSVSGTLSGPATRQYTLQNTNEILYDADFKRLTPITRSNGFVRDIVYSGSNAVTQRQFIYFDAGSSRGANSYTFTCDPSPIRWTLQCDGVVVHSQTTPNWSTSTTYTSLIQNGCTGQTFTLSIDAIQSTASNTLRISSFGVYNDQALLLTPQFTSNTETAPRFYTSTQAKGYFEVEPESETNFVFGGASSSRSGDIIIRLPCFVRISSCTLETGSARFYVSADRTDWVAPSPTIMALYLKIERTSPSMQGLSVFINSTQCII